jgi:hypothetical protein
MLEFDGINIWAVITVWLLYIIVGAFWYSPAGFGKQWTKYTGIDIMKKPQADANKAIIFVALSAIIQVVALALVLNSLQVSTATNGLIIGALIWLGFTAATTVGVTFYSNKSWKYLWLNSSYFLLVMLLGSVILSIWR